MDIEDITAAAIKHDLKVIKRTTSSNELVLSHLAIVSEYVAREGLLDSPAARQVTLGQIIGEIINSALKRLRHPPRRVDRERQSDEAELEQLQADFNSGNDELASWGAVFFQYLALSTHSLTALDHLGVPYHTFRRRCGRGLELTAQRLREIELNARRRTQPISTAPLPEGDGAGRDGASLRPPTRMGQIGHARPHSASMAIATSALTGALILAGAATADMDRASNGISSVNGASAAVSGARSILVVSPMDLQPAEPRIGEIVTATFRIRNTSAVARTIAIIRAGARGPHACSRFWNAPNVDFPSEFNIRLAPTEEHVYRQHRVFTKPGDYFAEPVQVGDSGRWGGIGPSPRFWFDVRDIRGQVTTPDCLIMIDRPTVQPMPVHVDDTFTVTMRLMNNTNDTIKLQKLVLAEREPDARQGAWSYPSVFAPSWENQTLQPHQAITYTTSRRATESGTFALEAVAQDNGKWLGIWPFMVTPMRIDGP